MSLPQLNTPDHLAQAETMRLDALHRLFILDTPPERSCNEITDLAGKVFPSCWALLTFVDEKRVWVKASTTQQVEASKPRYLTLCSMAVEQEGCTVILDVQSDPRVAAIEDPRALDGIRFYAGAPILTRDGQKVGMLCILDSQPWQSFEKEQEQALTALASLASDRLELRGMQQEARASKRLDLPDIRHLGERVLSLVPEHQVLVQGRMRLKQELARGIQKGELELYYQPEVNLKTRAVVGFEALVRWRHPTRGWLLPGEFIPLAEETGLINPLGDWALREACRQALVWRIATAGRMDLRVSVNLSASHFESTDLFDTVLNLLEHTGLDPEELRLEVTETGLLRSDDVVLKTMKRLRDIGVGLHMDDFGKGYSSLHTLHSFPFDTIKIDHSFISRVESDYASLQIVESILTLCQSLNLEVVAEGIETPAQAEILSSAGCQYGQGYLFAPPLHPTEIVHLLRSEIDGVQVREEMHFRRNL